MEHSKILEILTSSNEYVSGQSLARTLGVTRQAVWKEINSGKESGKTSITSKESSKSLGSDS